MSLTRADFFKRIAAFCGIGALAATVRPAVAETPWHLTPEYAAWLKRAGKTPDMMVRDWAFRSWQNGYIFRWTGAFGDNDWRNPFNWEIDGYFSGHILYPGQDPNRLDTVMIERGEVIMPVNIAVSLDSRVKGSGVWYRHANFGKGWRRGTWVLREDSTDWIEGQWV